MLLSLILYMVIHTYPQPAYSHAHLGLVNFSQIGIAGLLVCLFLFFVFVFILSRLHAQGGA